jgi:hypothetical protein
MRIKISKQDNIIDLIRRCGYSYRGKQACPPTPSRPPANDWHCRAGSDSRRGEEMVFVRRAGISEYPRFHIYLKEETDGFVLNLHLDQKRASYSGSRAHGGEHEGGALEKEAERIKGIIL